MSVLRSHNNKTRGGLGRVCATGMYRSIEHVKFPKFQTGIFVEWKAPYVPLTNITESRIPGVESRQDCLGFPNIGRNKDFSKKTPVFFPPREGGGTPFFKPYRQVPLRATTGTTGVI